MLMYVRTFSCLFLWDMWRLFPTATQRTDRTDTPEASSTGTCNTSCPFGGYLWLWLAYLAFGQCVRKSFWWYLAAKTWMVLEWHIMSAKQSVKLTVTFNSSAIFYINKQAWLDLDHAHTLLIFFLDWCFCRFSFFDYLIHKSRTRMM